MNNGIIARLGRPASLAGLVGALLLAGGCAQAPRGPTVPMIDKAGYTAFLEQQRGKVVLVDFWATWCDPCVRLFPHTMELHRRFAGEGLAVATISLDDPSQAGSVSHFLAQQGATTANFLAVGGGSPQPFIDFSIDEGKIPHLKLYDRQGRLYKTFIGAAKPEKIDDAVEELLRRS